MGTLLERWLEGQPAIPVLDEASVALVREEVRRRGGEAGMATAAVESLAAAASELAHNQLAHAHGGRVAVRRIEREGVAGVEVIAADAGPGIADPAGALGAEPRPRGSLGVGLGAAQRLSEELDIEVRLGEGSCLRARRFAAPVSRSEVAIYARSHPGESVCGDDGAARWTAGGLLLVVADGLGHGPLARDASAAAVDALAAAADLEPAAALAACGPALRGTRGAVAAVAVLDPFARQVRIAGAGNITGLVYSGKSAHRTLGNAYILGSPQPPPRFTEERFTLTSQRAVILFSDGITSRADLSDEPDVLRQHPIAVAQRLIERFSRRDDDVLVLAAR